MGRFYSVMVLGVVLLSLLGCGGGSGDAEFDALNSNERELTPDSLSETATGSLVIADLTGNQSVSEGADVVLTVTVTGSDFLTYQWYFDGLPLTGEVGPSLALSELESAQGGTYQVVVSNGVSEVTSDAISLSVLPTVFMVDVDVSWDVPAYRVDGSSFDPSEVVEYKVYFGSSESDLALYQSAGNTPQITLQDLTSGDYVVGVSILDGFGLESDISTVVNFSI